MFCITLFFSSCHWYFTKKNAFQSTKIFRRIQWQNMLRMHLLQSRISKFTEEGPPTYRRGEPWVYIWCETTRIQFQADKQLFDFLYRQCQWQWRHILHTQKLWCHDQPIYRSLLRSHLLLIKYNIKTIWKQNYGHFDDILMACVVPVTPNNFLIRPLNSKQHYKIKIITVYSKINSFYILLFLVSLSIEGILHFQRINISK